jgi:hypothetical protein
VVFLLPFAVSLLGAREAGAAPLTLAHPLPLALLAVSIPLLVAGTQKLRAAFPTPAAPGSTAAPVAIAAI